MRSASDTWPPRMGIKMAVVATEGSTRAEDGGGRDDCDRQCPAMTTGRTCTEQWWLGACRVHLSCYLFLFVAIECGDWIIYSVFMLMECLMICLQEERSKDVQLCSWWFDCSNGSFIGSCSQCHYFLDCCFMNVAKLGGAKGEVQNWGSTFHLCLLIEQLCMMGYDDCHT
jgi:hypothetical protein